MSAFTADQVAFFRVEPDGRALYTVALPGVSYDGQVRVTAERHAAGGTEAWIANRLSELAPRLGINVVRGRLYSPFDLAG